METRRILHTRLVLEEIRYCRCTRCIRCAVSSNRRNRG